MKRKILMLLTLFAGVVSAIADNTVSVGTALVPQGKTGTFSIELTNTDKFASSMEVHLTLPEGITFEGVTLSDRFTDIPSLSNSTSGQTVTITTLSGTNAAISGNSGPLLFVSVRADAEVAVGTKLTASITKMELAKKVGDKHEKWNPESFDFDIEITDKVILDENSPVVPIRTDEQVDILVKRTIRANEWSTICLPFAMSVDKLKAAFGDDYQLAYISGCEFEKDGDDKVTTIRVKFTDRTAALQVNRPYIIKVSNDITEFEVSNVKINPTDAYKTEITVEDDETGEDVTLCSMTGNLKGGTVVPANSLFLNNNKFYYSVGKTKCKAFRAWFWFKDLLSDVATSSSRITFQVDDGSTTGINDVRSKKEDVRCDVYDLQGRRIENPTKGLYIRNGRKEVIK